MGIEPNDEKESNECGDNGGVSSRFQVMCIGFVGFYQGLVQVVNADGGTSIDESVNR